MQYKKTNWTVAEIKELEEFSNEGVKALSSRLNRSEASIKMQASRYGISLRPRFYCIKCGKYSYKPLGPNTGWCDACTYEHYQKKVSMQVKQFRQELKEQEERSIEAKRKRDVAYVLKSREKQKMKNIKNHSLKRGIK